MDNYIVINGKKAELTEEQLEKLGIKVEKESPFAKRINKGLYYYITASGVIKPETEGGDLVDGGLYNNANYFNDKDFAQQVAWHELLNRKLLKYMYDNEWRDNQEWSGIVKHYYIVYDGYHKNFYATFTSCYKDLNTVYFPSVCAAQKAIEEVVKPFMEKHKDFKW